MATFLCMLILSFINSQGISAENEQKMKEQIQELSDLGGLSVEEFNKLQERFKESRDKQRANDPLLYKHITEEVHKKSRFVTWIPWIIIGFLVGKLSLLKVLVIIPLPIALTLVGVFGVIDILIYVSSFFVGNLLSKYTLQAQPN
jgi:ABC-type multidrug transport system fused ATPase/permease subunit